MTGTDAYNRQVIDAFRAGRKHLDGQHLLLLHHRGAKSSAARLTPLVYWPLTDTTVAVLASNYGAPSHPAWFHNLLANPDADIEIGDATVAVRARVAAPGERRAVLHQMMATTPGVAAAAARADRELPVVILDLARPWHAQIGDTRRGEKRAP
jgi:deazaflavin-dependent oxidoreductase (nitroreductase family)